MRMKKFMAASLVLALAGCAGAPNRQMSALDKAQYAWSAAIRWGDIDGAWQQVDPAYRAAHPLSDAQLGRYKQLQVTGYTVTNAITTSPTDVERTIEIGLANRNTMQARSTTWHESWHYDAASKAWWISNGLPDFWAGQ